MKILPFITVAVAVAGVPATAEFVPTLGIDTPRVCAERPPRPAWIENIDPREAHNGHLVMEIYRAQSLQAVVSTGECSCTRRFPVWDDAEAVYLEKYVGGERWEIIAATTEFTNLGNQYRSQAKTICRAQGNW